MDHRPNPRGSTAIIHLLLLLSPLAHAGTPGMSPAVWDAASRAWACAQSRGTVEDPIVTVIDYSLPSTERRLWVVDMNTDELLFHELVAHGTHTGERDATRFSNTPESRQTSLGVFKTAETYVGKHGLSLRLDGLEPGVNDNARTRDIVIHGADYVSDTFASTHGRLGRSWGCPAVRKEISRSLIEKIAGGTLLVAWYPDERWTRSSTYLSCSP